MLNELLKSHKNEGVKWYRKEDNQWSPQSGQKLCVFVIVSVQWMEKMAKLKVYTVVNSRHCLWICFGIAFHMITTGFGSKGKSVSEMHFFDYNFYNFQFTLLYSLIVTSHWMKLTLYVNIHW